VDAGTAMGNAPRIRDRLAAGFVLLLLGAGCLCFWIGLPLAFLWGLSKLTDSFVTHFVLGLLGVPIAMALFAPFLFWTNGLYLRVTGTMSQIEADQEAGWQRRVRGPLEPMLIGSFAVAFVALLVWFFLFAENPPDVL
jgi:hypothetical protein